MSTEISAEITLIIFMAVTIDYFAGEPPNRIHPVVLIGSIISYFTNTIKKKSENQIKNNKRTHEKLSGTIMAFGLTASIGLISYVIIFQSLQILGIVGFIIISTIILKITLSIKAMDKHIQAIIKDIEKKEIGQAQINLGKIVSRNTKSLSKSHILSACIECIAESFVDSIVSPLFYYGLFNIPGAIMFRVVNTLDSMIGYKNYYYKDIGWMSAKLDTFMNAIPARISIVFLILATIICREDWKNSIKIFRRDRKNTESFNAGIPMSLMAGALNVQLEKIDNYRLGDMKCEITIQKCLLALKITKMATLIFIICYLVPSIVLLNYLNWWSFFFGL